MPVASSFAEMFHPPVNRAMRVLDRSFFQKTVPIAAARVYKNDQISRCRTLLGRDLLQHDRIQSVRPDLDGEYDNNSDRKLILLAPEVQPDDPSTWSTKTQELVHEKRIAVTPYKLRLTYDIWTYHEIMSAILPENEHDELPTGFSVVGHVAHLNLRDQYLQYKHLIAAVLMDKNPNIRTVIRKIDEVGTQSEFRTFQYELLAGDPSLKVEARELDCIFRFDYSKVYWNSRLNTEHERLVNTFRPGDAVCDVMAGVGPFAVPAAKRKVFVWANDLNPDSYDSLKDAISRNKVSDFVRPFNEDGRSFIRKSTTRLMEEDLQVNLAPRIRRHSRPGEVAKALAYAGPRYLRQPKTFQHFVMNLPATAITFLDAFTGLYKGHEQLFLPNTDMKLPLIHVYCFSTKSDDNQQEKIKICDEISQQIGYTIKPGDEDVEIWDVRDVAPQKRMFCATFRLPAEVAYR